MRERVHFVLVTDNIDFVLADVFASVRTNAPSFVRIIDDPMEILALPEKCKVHHAVWTGNRMQSGAELAWRERRARGDLVLLTEDEMAKIAAWRARRAGEVPAVSATHAVTAPPSAPSSSSHQQWT